MNYLIIHSDQHRYDCVGANGHPFIKTPNLDRLAMEGVNFDQAYTPIPLCVPARNCQLFGCHSFRHRAIANFDTEACPHGRPGIPAYSELLKGAGYQTGYVGKWHVHPELGPCDFGFDFHIPERKGLQERRSKAGYPPYKSETWWGGVDKAPVELSSLAVQCDQAIESLERLANSGAPFLLRWDPPEPHLPNVVPEPFASMYPLEMLKPWPGFEETFEGKPFIQRKQLRTWGIEGWTWEDWSPIVRRYLGEISLLDHQIGRLLSKLDELGLAANTMVVYSSDHGDMCGSHRMYDKHYIMYDDVIRVPLIVRMPGGARGSVCRSFVCNELDLARSILETADLPVPGQYQGESLVPFLRGKTSGGRKEIVCVYHGNQMGLYTQRAIRDSRYKYVWNATAEDELYDLEKDPGELRNQAASPAYASVTRDLKGRLRHWMEANGDPILNEWTATQLGMTGK